MSNKQTIGSGVEELAEPASESAEWLPESEQLRRVLQQRARQFALAEEDDQELVKEAYIRFRLGSREHYGIPYANVDEILEASSICPVPCTPALIMGVRNRRGEMLTVIDLKEFFRPARDEDYAEDALIIVVQAGGMRAGILVNEVIGNDEFVPSELDAPAPANGVRDLRHIRGLCKGQVAILDMESLFNDPVFNVSEAVGTS